MTKLRAKLKIQVSKCCEVQGRTSV